MRVIQRRYNVDVLADAIISGTTREIYLDDSELYTLLGGDAQDGGAVALVHVHCPAGESVGLVFTARIKNNLPVMYVQNVSDQDVFLNPMTVHLTVIPGPGVALDAVGATIEAFTDYGPPLPPA